MFKRQVSSIVGENYCPVVEMTRTENKTAETDTPVRIDARTETTPTRGEIFVLAANIYYRARRNNRARAAGIL